MKNLNLTTLMILTTIPFASTTAAEVNLEGDYKADNGIMLSIKKGSDSSYQLVQSKKGAKEWKGTGYFSTDCRCIKSVFQYINSTKYGDDVGYHIFKLSPDGNTIIGRGGWSRNDEFPSGIYSRQ